MCIPVAICLGLCRCAVGLGLGGTGRSRAWLLQGPTGEREEKKQCYNLQRMGTFSHRYVGGTIASCAQQQLKVNAEQYVVHPSCYVVTGGMC